jgi:hypothetical protein
MWKIYVKYMTECAGSTAYEIIGFFNRLNPSSRTIALGSTEPITEMSTSHIPGGKWRPACKDDNLTAICEVTV